MKSVLTVSILLFVVVTAPVFAADEVVRESADMQSTPAVGTDTDKNDVESAADREAWAKSLFEGRCQMCHQLPEPDMLTPSQWKLILMVMQQRMQQAGVPPLTEDETQRLLEYLSARAR